MFRLFTFLFFALPMHCLGQGEDTSLLYWSVNRPLRFADFEATPPPIDTLNGRVQMHALSSISTGLTADLKTAAGKTLYLVRAVVARNASMMRNTGDSLALRHEQGHFDLCEVFARRLKRDLFVTKSLAECQAAYDAILVLEEAAHHKYDEENKAGNGGITPAWRKWIDDELTALQSWANPLLRVPYDK